MPKRPHSDRGRRATIRKAKRQMQDAKAKSGAAAKALEQAGAAPPPQEGIAVTMDGLMAKIGRLTVECDYWKVRAEAAIAELERIREEREEEEVPVVDGLPTEETPPRPEDLLATRLDDAKTRLEAGKLVEAEEVLDSAFPPPTDTAGTIDPAPREVNCACDSMPPGKLCVDCLIEETRIRGED